MVTGIIVTIVAAAASIGRLLAGTQNSVGQLVWAEDGLFALCVRKVGFGECFVDPFAGYLLGLPRLLAGVTSMTAIEDWGWTTNLVAAAVWGLLSGITAAWLVASRFRIVTAIAISVLPVIIPLAGFESINAVGSVYMPLLFTATVVLAVGWRSLWATLAAAALVLLAALTIPTSIVLLAIVVFSYLRGRVVVRDVIIVGTVLIVGLVGQLTVVFTAPSARNLTITTEGLAAWLRDLPNALVTLWPGLTFGEGTLFGFFSLPAVAWTGSAMAVVLLVVGFRSAMSSTVGVSLAGIIVISGLAFSFVPTVTGYASNRYFVLTSASLAAAIVLIVEQVLGRDRRWRFMAFVALFAIAWVTAFPASDWRSTASPEWSANLDRVAAECEQDPMAPVRFEFSPNWPQEGVTELQPPSNEYASCSSLDLRRAR